MSLFTGPYAGFIAASYAVAVLVIGGLVLAALIDHRAQLRALRALEERGVRRRSSAQKASDRLSGASTGEAA